MRRATMAAGKVNLFTDETRIVLQVRANGSQTEPLETWAKAAALLDDEDALQLAAELLNAVRRKRQKGA